jgi:phosphoribosyl-dephospho-CoA transferase
VTEGWQRHDLLRIDPRGWRCALSSRPDMAGVELLSDWADKGWPVMVRRYVASDTSDQIPVAICLPCAGGKTGMALQVNERDVLACLAPTSLSDAAPHAPSGWRSVLQQLAAIATRFGCAHAVFGSLLWQRLTGMTYLHAGSDLDLIWRVADPAQAVQLAAAIDACAAHSPVRIDGEFILPSGAAVNWREFHSRRQEVLVKTLRGVDIVARQQLFCL